jgi:kynurenine formamidase
VTDRVRRTAERYRNWGKWGPDDEIGTLNYISAESIVRAAHLVKRGVLFSLALPFDKSGPAVNHPRRFNPIHRMTLTGPEFSTGAIKLPGEVGLTDDVIIMPLQCGTQWDALSHCFLDGKLYNGFDANLVSSQGARRNGIEKMARGVVTRAVLVDCARAKGVRWLDPGYAITPDDLEAAIRASGVTVGTGDALLIRTGQIARCRAQGEWGDHSTGPAPGLGFDTAEWIHEREVAAVAADTWAVEVRPSEVVNFFDPLHQVFITNMGLLLGENFDLEALAEDCSNDGVYECLFVAAPLPITGAVGSPINPLAIK